MWLATSPLKLLLRDHTIVTITQGALWELGLAVSEDSLSGRLKYLERL